MIHHGTWPHGLEWLHEAAAETYLPLLRVLANGERDGIPLHCTLTLSPILLEQLTHPVFLAEFPKYLERKIVAAREDEAFFIQSGEVHYAETARFWHRFFTDVVHQFDELDHNIVRGFRHFQDAGLIDIVTSAATHGYLPLLGTDESVRAQIRLAVATHRRHLGKAPRGIWSPECGYRPAGTWNYPVLDNGSSAAHEPFPRIGVEQALSESALEFFYVDTHLVEEDCRPSSPYGNEPAHAFVPQQKRTTPRSIYQTYLAASVYDGAPATAFPRDPRTGMQVWSGEHGYPGDGNYLDFHKKRWPGGHRYWRVTGTHVGMGDKQPYHPAQAAERVRAHAAHFVELVADALAAETNAANPPILSALFDAELFGHWWFEGPQWLEAVAREIHTRSGPVALITSVDYLDRFGRAGTIAMPGGSWGAGGGDQVWLNERTSWTWTHIYPAERTTRAICSADLWRTSALAGRIVRQLCRELLLLESSDWQFLITTGAARDYAEMRFRTHLEQFASLEECWRTYEAGGSLSPEQEVRLSQIEERDSIFPDLDPGFWAAGAQAQAT